MVGCEFVCKPNRSYFQLSVFWAPRKRRYFSWKNRKCLPFQIVFYVLCIWMGYLLSKSYDPTALNFYFNWPILKANQVCKPRTNITFFKTHKTASCSIQNILLRYAKEKNQTLLLPLTGNYFGHPALFHRSMVPPLKDGLIYNIFCHHHRWNFPEVRKVMPPDTVYVTILRDPAQVVESLYYYVGFRRRYNLTLVDFIVRWNHLMKTKPRMRKIILRNQLSYDLGFNSGDFDNLTAIEDFIYTIHKQFDLVLIAERMEESLVLLKDLLCWSFDDVAVFRHNARLSNAKDILSDNETAYIRSWSNVDQKLYDYFYHLLQVKINHFGVVRMKKEVAELHERTSQWYEYCVDRRVPASNIPPKFRPFHLHTYGFILKPDVFNSTCESLIKGELPFTKEMRWKQRYYYAQGFNPKPVKRKWNATT